MKYLNSDKIDTCLFLSIQYTMTQDTGKFRMNLKDQFYTSPKVAQNCVETIVDKCPQTSSYLWIEPSAGNGAFLHAIPTNFNKIGLDLEPKAEDILLQDYLTWTPPARECIVFGNPPFGRQSSLAKSFISKSEYASIIAFILPKSFTKPSMFNAFGKKFHLIHSIELENNSFLRNNQPYNVPCVFQIWVKRETDRPIEKKIQPVGFRYVKTDYHFAIRRVGGLAGKAYPNNGHPYSVQSHYFVVLDVPGSIDTLLEKINAHTFPSNTVGPRSLSKGEINRVLNVLLSV